MNGVHSASRIAYAISNGNVKLCSIKEHYLIYELEVENKESFSDKEKQII